MIFRQHDLVVSGRKTKTRRLWHDGDFAWWISQAAGMAQQINSANGRKRFWVRQLMPITPKLYQPAVRINGQIARIEVLTLRREPLQDITEADAIAEGVSSVDEYRELWESINGKSAKTRWQANPLVVTIGFRMQAILEAAGVVAQGAQP